MSTKKRRSGRTKADLVDAVYRRHGGLTKKEATAVVEAIFSSVKGSLVEGKAVRIKNFGVFEVQRRPGRRGVDPASGDRVFIPPHRGLSFRPSRTLRDQVGQEEDDS